MFLRVVGISLHTVMQSELYGKYFQNSSKLLWTWQNGRNFTVGDLILKVYTETKNQKQKGVATNIWWHYKR